MSTMTGQWREMVDTAEALETLGLGPEADADDVKRAAKKLAHKHRKDEEQVRAIKAAATLLESRMDGHEGVALTETASPPKTASTAEEGIPPDVVPVLDSEEPSTPTTNTGQWRHMVDQAEALELLGLTVEANSNDIERAGKKLTHKHRKDPAAVERIVAAVELLTRLPPSPLAEHSAINGEVTSERVEQNAPAKASVCEPAAAAVHLSRPAQPCPESMAFKEEGNAYFKSGSMEKAIVSYTKAIEALPAADHVEGSVFYSNRAACYKNLGDYKSVVADCTSALQINATNWKAQMRRGFAYEALEKYELALDDLRKCGPWSAEARRSASRLTRTVRQLQECDSYGDVKISPPPALVAVPEGPAPAPLSEPAGARTVGDKETGSHEETETATPLAIDKAAEADKLKLAGNEAFKLRNYTEAIEKYSAAITLNPEDRTYYSNRSGAYLGIGNVVLALKDADFCIMLDGSWDKAHVRRAAALGQKGDWEGAVKSYTTALALNPQGAKIAADLDEAQRKLDASKAVSTGPATDGGNAKTDAIKKVDEAAMAAKRDGWLERKEGKLRKKWVRNWCELKAGRLTIYDCEPGGAVTPVEKDTIEMSSVMCVEKAPGEDFIMLLKMNDGKRVHYFQADMAMSIRIWLDALSTASS